MRCVCLLCHVLGCWLLWAPFPPPLLCAARLYEAEIAREEARALLHDRSGSGSASDIGRPLQVATRGGASASTSTAAADDGRLAHGAARSHGGTASTASGAGSEARVPRRRNPSASLNAAQHHVHDRDRASSRGRSVRGHARGGGASSTSASGSGTGSGAGSGSANAGGSGSASADGEA